VDLEHDKSILYLDLEPYNQDKTIREIGIVIDCKGYKSTSPSKILKFIQQHNPKFLCGHNLRFFDYQFLKETCLNSVIEDLQIIDTLELSLLFFSEKTIHKLPKSYKESDKHRTNDPLKDAIITRKLLFGVITRFFKLPVEIQSIYYSLLGDQEKFKPFFDIIEPRLKATFCDTKSAGEIIKKAFNPKLRNDKLLPDIIAQRPVELAYIVSVLHDSIELKSFPPKVFFDYPNIQELLISLTFNLDDEIAGLKDSANRYFGFDTFRKFPKLVSDDGLFVFTNYLNQYNYLVRSSATLSISPSQRKLVDSEY